MELTTQLENRQNLVKQPVSQKTMIEKLQAEVKRSDLFSQVCHVFAMRERARQQITVNSLIATMTKEGFNADRKSISEVLHFLQSIGIGALDYNVKGQLRALKGIKVTLQSIGLAAMAQKQNLDKYNTQPVFKKLPVTPGPKVEDKQIKTPPQPPVKTVTSLYTVTIVVRHDGEAVSFDLPQQMTAKDLGEMLTKLYA